MTFKNVVIQGSWRSDSCTSSRLCIQNIPGMVLFGQSQVVSERRFSFWPCYKVRSTRASLKVVKGWYDGRKSCPSSTTNNCMNAKKPKTGRLTCRRDCPWTLFKGSVTVSRAGRSHNAEQGREGEWSCYLVLLTKPKHCCGGKSRCLQCQDGYCLTKIRSLHLITDPQTYHFQNMCNFLRWLCKDVLKCVHIYIYIYYKNSHLQTFWTTLTHRKLRTLCVTLLFVVSACQCLRQGSTQTNTACVHLQHPSLQGSKSPGSPCML